MASQSNNHNNKMISARDIMTQYDVTYQTVNHYTDFGLLTVKAKRGNVRFYDKILVKERMQKIRLFIEEGYSLRLIRKKLIGI
tara:strand:- start:4494 stop:4742 length:249 start_codon:yes stop_codon:yes gene_type:complete